MNGWTNNQRQQISDLIQFTCFENNINKHNKIMSGSKSVVFILLDVHCSHKSSMKNNKRQLLKSYEAQSYVFTVFRLSEICLPTKSRVDFSCSFRVFFRTQFKVWKLTKGDNSKFIQWRIGVRMYCIFTYWDLTTYTVSCDTCCSFRIMSQTKFKV